MIRGTTRTTRTTGIKRRKSNKSKELIDFKILF